MKIYLDGRTSRRQEFLGYAAELKRMGWRVTARWLAERPENDQGERDTSDDARRRHLAEQDYADIKAADVVLVFSEKPRRSNSRGRRHVELGIGIGMGKKVCVVGPRENVYDTLPGVGYYRDWKTAKGALVKGA